MKRFDWDMEKNEKLLKERNISFEEIISFIEQGNFVDIVENPNPRYKHQKMFVLKIREYIYVVPFAETEETYFLKTIFPSRKVGKKYSEGGSHED